MTLKMLCTAAALLLAWSGGKAAAAGEGTLSPPAFDLSKMIECGYGVREFGQLAGFLVAGPDAARRLGWKEAGQRNPFLKEYRLREPITAFGMKTQRIAFGASGILGIFDQATPAALAARLRLEKFMDRDLADGSAKAMYYKVVENREERDASLGMTFVARRTLNVSNVTTHPKDVLAGCEYRIEAQ